MLLHAAVNAPSRGHRSTLVFVAPAHTNGTIFDATVALPLVVNRDATGSTLLETTAALELRRSRITASEEQTETD